MKYSCSAILLNFSFLFALPAMAADPQTESDLSVGTGKEGSKIGR